MSDRLYWSVFDLGTSAIYHITVHGYLDDSWSDHMGGVAIHNTKTDTDTPVTILYGELVDQAALFSVLNSLYALGFPLLAVECRPAARES